MLELMYHFSDAMLFTLLAGTLILASIIIIFLIRHLVPHELRMKDNAVIGSVSATISMVYGVLSGLVALYLINSITYAGDAVQQEANAVANIWRSTNWLDTASKNSIRKETRQYLIQVVTVEWPAMNRGDRIDNQGGDIIESMSDTLNTYSEQHPGAAIVPNLLDSIKALYDARHLRINASTTTLGPEIWLVVLIGSFLTLAVNYFYGMNLYLHMLASTAAALMVASILFLMITLDRPFQGEFGVAPNGLTHVLAEVDAVLSSLPLPATKVKPHIHRHSSQSSLLSHLGGVN